MTCVGGIDAVFGRRFNSFDIFVICKQLDRAWVMSAGTREASEPCQVMDFGDS